jgi:hypothetical protein
MRPSRRISRRFETQADRRVNSIGWDEEFRNQQVAGSIPAGGSTRPPENTTLQRTESVRKLPFLLQLCQNVSRPCHATLPVSESPLPLAASCKLFQAYDGDHWRSAPLRRIVNYRVGWACSFGSPDVQAHPVVNRIHSLYRSPDQNPKVSITT